MHILEIPSFLPPYGGYFCVEQARALKDYGHEVRILCCQQLGITVYPWHFLTARYGTWHEETGGIEALRTNIRGIPHHTKVNMQRTCNAISRLFNEYISRYGMPDVIHAHCCQWAGVAASILSKRTGIPFYITEHIPSGIIEANYGKGWSRDTWAKALMREAYESAACVIPVARELVGDIAPFFGEEYRWQEVSNVIDVDYFSYKEREPLTGRKHRLCCLAVANKHELHRKGYDTLLKAFARTHGSELHIAGRDTDGKPMRELIDALLTEEKRRDVHVHGELGRDETKALLHHCDALVLASRSEVQPLVVLEAMSTGIPVAGTTVIPQSERIEGACIITPIDDDEALSVSMERLKGIAPSRELSDSIRRIASPKTIASKLTDIFTNKA